MKNNGENIVGIEGYSDAKWILVDLGDVVVNIFDTQTRSFYDLDLLWGDAPKIPWEQESL